METKEYKLLDGRTIRAKYNRLGRCNISKENLESFVKEFNASYRQAKILEKIKENYALMKVDERKIGKWIIDDYEELNHITKVWRCHCSSCNKDPMNFVYGSENWWTYKHKLPHICPNCGSLMESEQLLSYADQDTMQPAT